MKFFEWLKDIFVRERCFVCNSVLSKKERKSCMGCSSVNGKMREWKLCSGCSLWLMNDVMKGREPEIHNIIVKKVKEMDALEEEDVASY